MDDEDIPMIDVDYSSQEERRKIYQAVPYERRAPITSDIHTRVAVLEVKTDAHSNSIFGFRETHEALVNKLDSHILASTNRDHELQMSVSQITLAVTNLSDNVVKTNESLTTIAEMATESRNQIVKWDTWVTAILKIASILAIIIGALFSLVQFVESRNHESLPVSQIPAHVADELANVVK
jgi:hypothetical protein